MCVISTAGLIYSLHLHQEISSLRSKLARVDYLGMSTFVASTTLMLYGLTTGGTTHSWKSASVLAPLMTGVTGLGVFILVEWKVAKAPMVPIRIFSNRTANAGFFGAFIHGLVLWTFTYYFIIFVCRTFTREGLQLTLTSSLVVVVMPYLNLQRRLFPAGKYLGLSATFLF
jgi:uncharacterized protein YggT (Ycf19 family)